MKIFRKPIEIRSDTENHRQATWIELFIDLAFVVGISRLGVIFEDGFHWESLTNYSLLFLLMFWIWNRFTWYATMYDNDDVPYRLAYLLLVFPALGIISQLESILEGYIFIASLYYLLINCILLYLWSRVLRRGKTLKNNARSFFLGYSLSTLMILISLFVSGQLAFYLIGAGFIFEVLGPILGWYMSKSNVPLHSEHIIERHGLFTIILLGESVVAIAANFSASLTAETWFTLAGSYLLIICLWWMYFDCGYGFSANLSKRIKNVFEFGYGQFFVYLSIALVGISLEYTLHHIHSDHVNGKFLSGQIVLFSISLFLIIMSTIQILISIENPKRIYLPRYAVGASLFIIGFFHFSNSNYLIIGLILMVLLTVNDVYQWGKLKVAQD